MTEHENQLASRLDSYSKNEALKARFMADPKQVLAEYDQATKEMWRQRHRLVEQAVERRKKILTEEQVRKYEEMRSRRREGRSGRGRGRRFNGPPGGRRRRPASRPAKPTSRRGSD